MASPMPWAPPVTTATLSCNFMMDSQAAKAIGAGTITAGTDQREARPHGWNTRTEHLGNINRFERHALRLPRAASRAMMPPERQARHDHAPRGYREQRPAEQPASGISGRR